MTDWISCRLAEACASIDYGFTASANPAPVGPKFLRITDIVGGALRWDSVPHVEGNLQDLKRYQLAHEDIVIARTGATTGESNFIQHPPEAVFASYLVRLKIKKEFNARFVSYWLKSPQFRNYLSGVLGDKSAQPNASASTMTNAPITLPADRGYQRAIVSVLGALDDKIELNRRMNETLEAMARAIFKDWFVDFGPTRARMEGRAPYLAAEIWSLFPDRLDDDGKPEGWARVPLATLVEVNPSEQLPRGKRAPYLDMASIPTTGPNPEPCVLREFGSGMRFRNGDALLARITPCLENGKCAFVQSLPEGEVGWGSTEFIVLRSRPPVPKPLAYLIARDPVFRASAIRSMTGTSGRQRASNDAVSNFPVFQPSSNNAWRNLDSVIDPMFERIAANEKENHTLAATRYFLLPKLMSGEVRVKDAEKLVGEAT